MGGFFLANHVKMVSNPGSNIRAHTECCNSTLPPPATHNWKSLVLQDMTLRTSILSQLIHRDPSSLTPPHSSMKVS